MKRMSMKRFCAIVRETVERLPPVIRRHLKNVVIDVEEQPSEEFLRAAGFTDEEIAAGETLYGYFQPLEGVSAADMLENPNRIIIFKRPLEEDYPDPEQLRIEIRKTVIHEIAHHFGWTDRDLEQFDNDPNPFARDHKSSEEPH
ncbi:MAG: metallopeptidase family protein [Gemmataceae bacterium]|nr:metallopeptidase family protein [Gemmataceae bacterium]MDW8243516.1 metallopeptidase family protein [Thermogemmata sp.]